MRCLTLLVVCALWAPAQTALVWTPELSMRMQNVGSVVPSPDGRMAVWTQSTAVMEGEKSEWVSQVWLGTTDGSRRFQLTRGEKSAGAPSFSPDGRFVYFSSGRSGKPNLYRIAVDGGEAEMITDWKGSLGSYRVSPDGKWVAFTAIDEDKDEEKARKEKRDFRVIDDKPRNHALWLIPAEAGSEGKRAPRRLTREPYHVTQFDWSPDSRSIAYSHVPAPEADHWGKADLAEVAVESGAGRALANTAAAESDPHYSPDGRFVAFVQTTAPPRWPGEERIAIVTRAGGEVRTLSLTRDERPNLAGWSPDSARVLFVESNGTRNGLYALPLDGPPLAVYETRRGVLQGLTLNAKGTHAGAVFESPEEAPEAFVLALPGGKMTRVSEANTGLPKPPTGETRLVRWKSKDGLEIEGLLTLPVGYQEGKRYPLILNIHGGPAGVFNESFTGRPGIYPLASLAAKGYAVLRPNPRGSGGYGKKFRFANLHDWGGADYLDLMTGVDHLVATGVADPDRLAVMGWSYGGFMTSWVVTQTKRFKAAVIGAAVTNLWSFTGTTDISGFLPDYFRGEPWENFAGYQKHSPMSHVKGVTTPSLILHGEADLRVPVSQGYEFYNALKRQGVTARMVVYPRMPHGPGEPKFQLDIMQRHIDWVEKYVK
ncbi:MAG: S9 family peptidase [Bryobacterales bacterium]|nr:S9 family peptidase [Bryobacterales bacterium]